MRTAISPPSSAKFAVTVGKPLHISFTIRVNSLTIQSKTAYIKIKPKIGKNPNKK
jgi:hypothetical protein